MKLATQREQPSNKVKYRRKTNRLEKRKARSEMTGEETKRQSEIDRLRISDSRNNNFEYSKLKVFNYEQSVSQLEFTFTFFIANMESVCVCCGALEYWNGSQEYVV